MVVINSKDSKSPDNVFTTKEEIGTENPDLKKESNEINRKIYLLEEESKKPAFCK